MSYENYSTTTAESTDLFAEETLVYAGFWERFFAAFIDGLILLIPKWIITMGLGEGVGNLIGILLVWLYFALLESGRGQATLGKKVMGLKVVNLEGQQISFGQATGRHFGKILSTIILLIGYLMMLWDDKKQTLHDKMANTLVIKS